MTTSQMALMKATLGSKRNPSAVGAVMLAIAGSALIAVCARIQVPMWPVPLTMQTFAVLLIGFAYGSRLGAATVALYLLEGAVGLPVLATGAGLAYFAGPTAGYLFGFVAAAAFVGWLADRGWGRSAGPVFVGMLAGSAVIYLFGVGWLAAFVGVEKALALGAVPFVPGDALKAVLAAAVLPVAWCLRVRF